MHYWIWSNAWFPRRTFSRMCSGLAVQTNGLGSALVSTRKRLMAAVGVTTAACRPARPARSRQGAGRDEAAYARRELTPEANASEAAYVGPAGRPVLRARDRAGPGREPDRRLRRRHRPGRRAPALGRDHHRRDLAALPPAP